MFSKQRKLFCHVIQLKEDTLLDIKNLNVSRIFFKIFLFCFYSIHRQQYPNYVFRFNIPPKQLQFHPTIKKITFCFHAVAVDTVCRAIYLIDWQLSGCAAQTGTFPSCRHGRRREERARSILAKQKQQYKINPTTHVKQ